MQMKYQRGAEGTTIFGSWMLTENACVFLCLGNNNTLFLYKAFHLRISKAFKVSFGSGILQLAALSLFINTTLLLDGVSQLICTWPCVSRGPRALGVSWIDQINDQLWYFFKQRLEEVGDIGDYWIHRWNSCYTVSAPNSSPCGHPQPGCIFQTPCLSVSSPSWLITQGGSGVSTWAKGSTAWE